LIIYTGPLPYGRGSECAALRWYTQSRPAFRLPWRLQTGRSLGHDRRCAGRALSIRQSRWITVSAWVDDRSL